MSRKKQHKKEQEQKIATVSLPPKSKRSSKGWIRIILVATVFLLYGNSINYEFTVDDNLFYTKHVSVQKGVAGIGEAFTYGSLEKRNGMKGVQPYRPVTLTSFAIQKQLFNNDPLKVHLVNVILYALLVLILFNILMKLLPSANPIICGLIALLFTVHPIHTEVVASVKSQDELLAAIFSLLALSYAVSLVRSEKYSWKYSLLSFLFFSLALLSKENAFAMILIFPLAFLLLLSQTIKRSLLYSLPYIGAALIFLFVRQQILAGQVQNYHNTVLENVLYGAGSFAESSATKMEILFHYLRLSFFPWQLSWDYSYNEIPIVNWSSVSAWISLLLYGALLAYAVLQARKKPVISFAILFYMIMLAPTANLFFLNGSTVSERFLFLPSLGFVIALVYGLAAILKTNVSADSAFGLNKFTGILLLVILVFAGLTISRSNEWKSNLSIFQSGVENAPNSARTNAALGVESRKAAEKETDPRQRATYFRDAIKYSKESLDILPSCKDALYNLGVTYMETGDSANAVKTYHNLLYYYPDHRSALTNLGAMFFSHNRFDSAYQYLKRSYDSDTTFAKSSQSLAIYYFKLADYSQAIKFAGNAIRLDKSILISYDLLSQAYKAIGNEGEADKYKMLYQQVYMEASESGNTFSDTE